MTDHRLEITVRRDGSIAATTHDVTGAACLDYIALLEDLLEAETVTSRYTDDFVRIESAHRASLEEHTPTRLEAENRDQ